MIISNSQRIIEILQNFGQQKITSYHSWHFTLMPWLFANNKKATYNGL